MVHKKPSFFKIMLGDFAHQLRIPPAFVKHFNEASSREVLLQISAGRQWAVKLKKLGNELFLKEGWECFVEDNCIESGDFLVFRLFNYSKFHVTTYDKSGCERERATVDDVQHMPCPRREKLVKISKGCVKLKNGGGKRTLGKKIASQGVASLNGNNESVSEGTPTIDIERVFHKLDQRPLNFRGVSRRNGKYTVQLWDGSMVCEAREFQRGRARRGRRVYLGAYETVEEAAQIYDLAALKYWGSKASTRLNFPICNYEKQLEETKSMSRDEFLDSLRGNKICVTRGCSNFRGVMRQSGGSWRARIVVAGGKYKQLGSYKTEEEAAKAYDIAAVKLRGTNATTNFSIEKLPKV